jgi:hypothetical protein
VTKKLAVLSVLTLLAAVAISIRSAAATNAGDSTNGHGTFTTGGTAVTRFVLNARVKGDGTITGRARFFDNGSLNVDIEVDCLTISGNTAIVGGTDKDDSTITYAFKVTDNGGGSPADRITLPQVGQTCSTFNTLNNFALTSGDIEVRDNP